MAKSTKWNEKTVRQNGRTFKLCMWSNVPLSEYYAVQDGKGTRKGCFHDPCCAVSWIQCQMNDGKLQKDKGQNRLLSIMADLKLDGSQPLMAAPVFPQPTYPDFGYLSDNPHMSRYPVFQVSQEESGAAPLKKGAKQAKYKTQKRLYCYLMMPREEAQVKQVEYRDFVDQHVGAEKLSLHTFKSKDVILLYNGFGEQNRRAEAMFPGSSIRGTCYILARKPLHDDGSIGEGNVRITEKHQFQKQTRKRPRFEGEGEELFNGP